MLQGCAMLNLSGFACLESHNLGQPFENVCAPSLLRRLHVDAFHGSFWCLHWAQDHAGFDWQICKRRSFEATAAPECQSSSKCSTVGGRHLYSSSSSALWRRSNCSWPFRSNAARISRCVVFPGEASQRWNMVIWDFYHLQVNHLPVKIDPKKKLAQP